MDTSGWIKALGLFVTYPVLIVATFIVAAAAFSFAWWLRGHILKERIAVLGTLLETARSQYQDVKEQLSDVKRQLEKQQDRIAEVMKAPFAPARLQELSTTNTAIQNAVTNLSTSTTSLGTTLTIIGGRYELATGPSEGITIIKRST